MNAKARKTSGVIRWILLIAIVISIGIGVLSSRPEKNGGMPMPFGIGVAVVKSGSMEPELYKGDLLVVNKVSSVAVGDVIMFKSDGLLTVHRIVEINGEQITTRGDANNANDNPITNSDVIGKVLFGIPGVGTVVEKTKTPMGITITCALIILLMLGSFAKDNATPTLLRHTGASAPLEKNNDNLSGDLQ